MFACLVKNCNQRFFQKNKFENHSKYHHVVKEVNDDTGKAGLLKYECKICKKLYNRMAHLTDHELSHSEERLFPCDECHMGFNRKYSLKIHKEQHTKMKSSHNKLESVISESLNKTS